MTLDSLYKKVKHAKYPINNREELMQAIGSLNVEFEKDFFDARDIGTMITEYPIKKPSHLIELFINSAQEQYELSNTQAKDFRKIEK